MSEKIVKKQFTFWNFTSCWKPFWFILLFLDLNISPSMSSENSNTCNKEILIFCWKKLKIIFPLINRLPVVFHFLIDCSRVLITGHKLNWKLKANPGVKVSLFLKFRDIFKKTICHCSCSKTDQWFPASMMNIPRRGKGIRPSIPQANPLKTDWGFFICGKSGLLQQQHWIRC